MFFYLKQNTIKSMKMRRFDFKKYVNYMEVKHFSEKIQIKIVV
jgi:hypothetical protein